MENKIEVTDYKLTTKGKIIISGVAVFIGILTWIISRLLKKDDNQ